MKYCLLNLVSCLLCLIFIIYFCFSLSCFIGIFNIIFISVLYLIYYGYSLIFTMYLSCHFYFYWVSAIMIFYWNFI